jgi:hypothetical protein
MVWYIAYIVKTRYAQTFSSKSMNAGDHGTRYGRRWEDSLILRRIYKERMKMWAEFIWLRIGFSGGLL